MQYFLKSNFVVLKNVLNLDLYVLLYLFISNVFLNIFEKYYYSLNFQVSIWNIEYIFSLASFYTYFIILKVSC